MPTPQNPTLLLVQRHGRCQHRRGRQVSRRHMATPNRLPQYNSDTGQPAALIGCLASTLLRGYRIRCRQDLPSG